MDSYSTNPLNQKKIPTWCLTIWQNFYHNLYRDMGSGGGSTASTDHLVPCAMVTLDSSSQDQKQEKLPF